MNVTLSVLICSYNRPALLEQALVALTERINEKPDQIVIVNGGDARSDRIVQKRATSQATEIKLVRTVNQNLAASRNVGLPYCTGEIVGMTDDDAEVFPDWVTQMKNVHLEHPDAGAVGGPVIGADSDSFISRLSDAVTFPAPLKPQPVRTLPGVNVSYKRAVVAQLGAQDESLFRGEDVDYNWRVQKLGWSIFYDPRIRVLHHHRPTLRGFLNQHYMYGRAYYRVRKKWPEMYCVYPHNLRRPRDIVKALNFVAAVIYEPLIYAARMGRFTDKLAAYPLFAANQVAWRGGMLREKFGMQQPK